jgi:hypothetical protein
MLNWIFTETKRRIYEGVDWIHMARGRTELGTSLSLSQGHSIICVAVNPPSINF